MFNHWRDTLRFVYSIGCQLAWDFVPSQGIAWLRFGKLVKQQRLAVGGGRLVGPTAGRLGGWWTSVGLAIPFWIAFWYLIISNSSRLMFFAVSAAGESFSSMAPSVEFVFWVGLPYVNCGVQIIFYIFVSFGFQIIWDDRIFRSCVIFCLPAVTESKIWFGTWIVACIFGQILWFS